jgi:hypothetical protein
VQLAYCILVIHDKEMGYVSSVLTTADVLKYKMVGGVAEVAGIDVCVAQVKNRSCLACRR